MSSEIVLQGAFHSRCKLLSASKWRLCARLPLQYIFEMILLFINTQCTVRQAECSTERAQVIVLQLWKICRWVYTAALQIEPKIRGTYEQPVQIDESYIAGRSKYYRVRLLQGDNNKQNNYEELTNWNKTSRRSKMKTTTIVLIAIISARWSVFISRAIRSVSFVSMIAKVHINAYHQ